MRGRFVLVGVVAAIVPAVCQAGPIYVFKEPDGSIRFSSKTPPPGVEAKVFTARDVGFSKYRAGPLRSNVLHRKAYNDLIERAARTYNLEAALVKAVIHVESAFNPRAVSAKGAMGLMQLIPSRARLLGVRDAFSPEENVFGGSRHLAFLLKKYNGDVHLALAAYNAGEEAVSRYGGIPPYDETRQYVQRVVAMKQRYSTLG